MNLLAYVIPALREIRAPLVGGYLWLFAGWLFAADRVPQAASISPDSAWAPLHRIADAIGSAGNVVVVSAAAFLVGSIVGEFVTLGLKRSGVHPDTLGDLAEAVPETKYLVDRGLQVHAEAELRLHIALPSVLITAAFVSHGAWPAAVVSAVVVVAMTWHGIVLVHRAQHRAQIAETRAVTSANAMTLDERQRQEAHVDALVITFGREARRSSSSRMTHSLRLINTGRGPALGVDVDASGAPLSLASGVLPLEELPPGEVVEVPLVLLVPEDTPGFLDVTIRWTDGTGPRSYVKVLAVG